MHEYFREQGDDSDTVTLAIGFSFRAIPKLISDYRYEVFMTSMTVYLKLVDNISDAIAMSKTVMDKVKLFPGAQYLLVLFYNLMYQHSELMLCKQGAGRKASAMFANVPGFIKPVKFFGGNAKRWFITGGSGAASLATSICITSITKRMQLAVSSDEACIKDLDRFVEIFNHKIQELHLAYDDSEEGQD